MKLFQPGRHKLSGSEVDKSQMLGNSSKAVLGTEALPGRIFRMALELLSRCGMISRASSRIRSTGDAAHQALSSRVHYSSVMFCNWLNLFGGSHV